MDDPYYTMHKEHEAWLALVNGSRPLAAIKAWGDALAELRIEEFKRTLRAAIQEAGNAIALLQASK